MKRKGKRLLSRNHVRLKVEPEVYDAIWRNRIVAKCHAKIDRWLTRRATRRQHTLFYPGNRA